MHGFKGYRPKIVAKDRNARPSAVQGGFKPTRPVRPGDADADPQEMPDFMRDDIVAKPDTGMKLGWRTGRKAPL